MIHKLVIVPSKGHVDDDGKYDLGRFVPEIVIDGFVKCLVELDVIDAVVRTMVEMLTEHGVRFEVMNTRKHPGIPSAERHMKVEQNSFVVEISCGWFDKKPRTRNKSQIFFGGKEARLVADRMGDVLAEWGTCLSFGHQVSNPIEDEAPLLNVPGCAGVKLEIFALNGPDVAEYLKRLPMLGRDLGILLCELVKKEYPSADAYHPYTRKIQSKVSR